ncbi:MAG TPA: SGNH/GDSL hydrolase family protein [Pirellulales bacterium]|nr:SGNH/GDSL hydrolase family protein [Pirellulales bacterium]
MIRTLTTAFLLLVMLTARRARAAEPFELKDGERIVLLGNTLIERDQEYGYLETALVSRWPDRNLTFRNLGWSGDTVWGDARASFDTAAQGFQRLKDLVLANKPTTIFVSYGTNEAFAGEKGLPEFQKGLDRLLDAIAESKARIILISPLKQEDLGRPLPDPTVENGRLKLYCERIRATAEKRGLLYLDLFDSLEQPTKTEPNVHLTDDGQHLSPYGYWRFARAVERALHLAASRWDVSIAADGHAEASSASHTKITELKKVEPAGWQFSAHDQELPLCPPPAYPDSNRVLRVAGLPAGQYTLSINGQAAQSGSAADWSAGVRLLKGPEFAQVEALRAAINAKNQLYFYRWRPQNETYLLGFRKHEQGRNAVEIVQFDPLIADQEAQIAKLRQPAPLEFRLAKDADKSPPK